MKADKNTIIGFVLLAMLFIGYFWLNNKDQKNYEAQQKHISDSLALVRKSQIKPVSVADSLHTDSLAKSSAAGGFTTAANGTEQTQTVETDLLKITFTNKGGQIQKVELKKYKSYDSTLVNLGGADNKLGFAINTSANSSQNTSNLFFTALPITKDANGNQIVTYQITDSGGKSVQNQFTIPKDDYLIDWNINLNGAQQLLTGNTLNLVWNGTLHRAQYAVKYEKEQSSLCYNTPNDGYDFDRAAGSNGANKNFNNGANWVSFKQQFFNEALIAKNNFKDGNASMTPTSKDLNDTAANMFNTAANLQIQIPATAAVSIPMQLYYGPNDYYVLKKYDNGMKNLIDLGSGMWAFAKYLNIWIIMPVFTFIAKFVSNFGWVIILLTIFIRLITSPLTYKGYYSSAKMKVLKPELDELRKKFPEQQTYALEQMKLYREAGVNPLSGCFPLLLQLPIFIALWRFFNSNLALRGQSFLWAKDLSSYDSIIHFGTNIPLIGDHLSLLTITYCVTSMFTSMYNMNMSAQSNQPGQEMMKYMPYIMPIVMFFAFNSYPCALMLYYTVSNLVTLGIQLVIQKYIINHAKILEQINEKRKQPKQKSKFQLRMEQMQEQQKKLEEMRKRTQR